MIERVPAPPCPKCVNLDEITTFQDNVNVSCSQDLEKAPEDCPLRWKAAFDGRAKH